MSGIFTPAECSIYKTGNYLRTTAVHIRRGISIKRWRSKMKTLIAALALLSLATGPVFAQTFMPQGPHAGYGFSSNSPALTGGGSFGHNRLQQELGN
jgi:hypothetical protein